MTKHKKTWVEKTLLGYFIVFILLHLLNLDRLPIVWFDEIMGLDPAVNAVFKGGYRSMIWPQTGTEQHFMAYLPVRFLFHMTHLSLLPFEVYFQRLPWAIYFFASAYMLYRAARTQNVRWIALLLVFFLINDKTVFEVARSMRVDPLSLMFTAATLWSYYRQKHGSQMLLATLLVFIHPNLWALALVMFFGASFLWNKRRGRHFGLPNLYWAAPVLLFGLYAYSFGFDFQGHYVQLFEHGSRHSAEGGLTQRFIAHFYSRFWPYYISQPWMPLLIYLSLGLSLFKVIRKRSTALDVALILTHLYWLAVLAPFYRYNAVLMLLSLASLIPELHRLEQGRKVQWTIAVICLLMPLNVLARHLVGLVEREERDPQAVVHWLQEELKDENCLIFGHDVAYYAVAKDGNKDYMMFNLLPSKFQFSDYDKVYVLLSEIPDDLSFTRNLPKYYTRPQQPAAIALSQHIQTKTYRQLLLFEVKDEASFHRLLRRMDAVLPQDR